MQSEYCLTVVGVEGVEGVWVRVLAIPGPSLICLLSVVGPGGLGGITRVSFMEGSGGPR